MEDNRKEVVSKLKGDRLLKCPFCKWDRFIRKTICSCNMALRGDEVIDEDSGEEEYEYYCANCLKDVTNEELE